MGFQIWTFPLAIYGCVDTASQKLMWLKIWSTNSDPILIGKWYLEALLESHTLPHLCLDKEYDTSVSESMIHEYDT